MKNKEKFRDEILEIAYKGDSIARNKYTGELVECNCENCSDCAFNYPGKLDCKEACCQWMNEDYKNPAAVKQYSIDILTKDGKLSEGDVESALLAAGIKVVGIQFMADMTDEYKKDYKELLE